MVKIARLENQPVFATGDGWGYCFICGPQPHPSTSYSPVVISSLIDAQTFFNALNVGEKELRLFAHHNPAIALLLEQEGDFLQRFVEGLADRSILAYKVPVHSAAPPVKALEFVAASIADRSVTLGPESRVKTVTSGDGKREVKADKSNDQIDANSHAEGSYTRPTAEEIAIAKSEGNSHVHIQARGKVSRYFLQSNGFSETQIATAIGDEATGIDGGVDLTKPVEIMNFPPPESMTQYVNSHGFPGNWFDPLGNQTPDALGLNGYGRKLTSFKVPTGQGLLSHSKPVVDNWTNPLDPVSTRGGGKQLFINDNTKKSIISLNKVGM